MLDHLSYSSISAYTLCPRSFKFHYIDKVQTPTPANLVFGSAYHGTIEAYIITHARGAVHPDMELSLPDLWEIHWQKQLADERNTDIAWGDTSESEMLALGKRMLKNQVTVTGSGGAERKSTASHFLAGITPLMENDKPVIEKYVELQIPGVPIPIIGYIDMITADNVPCDFKTAGRAWGKDKAKQQAQPAIYLAALNQMGFDVPDLKFRFYIFTKTKAPKIQIIETKRILSDLFWLFDSIKATWEAIESGAFPPKTGDWHCTPKWCRFWDICRGK